VRLTPGPHPIAVEHGQLDARVPDGTAVTPENAWGVGWFGRDVERSLSPVPAWALWTVPPSLWRMQAARIVDPIPMLTLAAFAALALWTGWQRRWLSRIALPRPDWALLLILAFGAYFRLQYIELPMAEKHSWRQDHQRRHRAQLQRHVAQHPVSPPSAGAAPASRTSGWSFHCSNGRARCSFAGSASAT
jgi:hypothetical protein